MHFTLRIKNKLCKRHDWNLVHVLPSLENRSLSEHNVDNDVKVNWRLLMPSLRKVGHHIIVIKQVRSYNDLASTHSCGSFCVTSLKLFPYVSCDKNCSSAELITGSWFDRCNNPPTRGYRMIPRQMPIFCYANDVMLVAENYLQRLLHLFNRTAKTLYTMTSMLYNQMYNNIQNAFKKQIV